MNIDLKALDDSLSTPRFFDFLKSINADDALDLRDSEPFDSLWMDCFNKITKEEISQDNIFIINQLREKSFKLSFHICHNAEISSRISDDIELIAKTMVSKSNDDWAITVLWENYRNGKFPTS
ncbi:MAG: hypothetical protein ACRDC2_16025 [Plesiomonas shigelloides]